MTELPGGVVYGVRLRTSWDYRYIGQTSKSAEARLRKHFQVAASGRRTPFYDWLRKQSREDVVVDVLSWIEGRKQLGQAEVEWISYLRAEGQSLRNLSDGGLGPTGIVWTEEMREAARVRSTGRPGVRRYGPDGPFFGHHHSAEQKAKWAAERKGMNSGPDNPNYGKFGKDHPSFGHKMSPEARQRLSEQRRGAGNPNYGKKASAETRAKMSAVRKGRPMPSSRRSAYTRHHTNKGVVKDSCRYCAEDQSKQDGRS